MPTHPLQGWTLPALLVTLAPTTLWASAKQTPKTAKQPNIIVFIVDDMGWQDTSVHFADSLPPHMRHFHTPHMERLAERGIKFTQAYAHSVSSPSRCSLLTGAHATRHGVTNWTLKRDVSTDEAHARLTFPQWNVNGISPDSTTTSAYYATMLPELLRRAGYHTVHCGKAHFGAQDTAGEDPLNLGFEVNISGHAAGGLASYLGERRYGHDAEGKPTSPFAVPGLEKYWDTETFATEALTQEAIAALERQRSAGDGRPFFLYMSHYAVHVPFDKDMRYYQKYLDRGLSPNESAYAALVEGMDKSLGDLMGYLQARGIDEETMIIFLSDNGGLSASGHWRDKPLHQHNAPLYSGKGSLHEGGVRIPLIVRLPGAQEGRSSQAMVQIEDIFPTLLELSGASSADVHQPLDGRSLVSILKGKRSKGHKTLYWHYPHNWGPEGPGINYMSAIREGKWKLIYSYDTASAQLYNLESDLGEQDDLSARYPKQTARLKRKLSRYLRQMGAQTPIDKQSGRHCPLPDGTLLP